MKIQFLILLAFLFFIQSVTGQNVTIDYHSWNSASGCDVFNPTTNVPANVGGSVQNVQHITRLGDVLYFTEPGGANKGVELNCFMLGIDKKGTGFGIKYDFKANYTYAVKVICAVSSNAVGPAAPSLRLRLNNSGSGGGITCNGAETISDPSLNVNPAAALITSTTFGENIFSFPAVAAGGFSYLDVLAIPGTSSNTIRIKNISIVETPPVPAFVLSPNAVNVQCGASLSQTFTVTNVYNSPGVTSYEWNLGNAVNGWTYNGNPAPQLITTTTNSISLVSTACSNVLSNVGVTVKMNGSNYQTLNATSGVSPASFAITGPDHLCFGSTSLSVSNISCGGNVSWSSSNTSVATVTSSGSTTTLTRVGSGKVVVTATVNACGVSQSLSKTLVVGEPVNLPLKLNFNNPGGSAFCRNSALSFEVFKYDGAPPSGATLANDGITDIQWRVVALSGPSTVIQYNAGNYYGSYSYPPYVNAAAATLKFPSSSTSSTGTIQINLGNACGWSAGEEGDGLWITPVNGNISVSNQNCGFSLFSMSPNPASNVVTITKGDDVAVFDFSGQKGKRKVNIYDNMGVLKKSVIVGGTENLVQLNVADLKNGIYFVEFGDQQKSQRKQLVIHR